MIYTGLLSLLLAEYAANQKCSAVLLCSADSIYQCIRGTSHGPGSVRLSVSVTSRGSTKTAKQRITQNIVQGL